MSQIPATPRPHWREVMTTLFTADEFITLILSKIKLSPNMAEIEECDLDWRFERAYDALTECVEASEVILNFTFYREPLYGNSATLRDALIYAKERHLIEPSSAPGVYQVTVDENRARAYLERSPIDEAILARIVTEAFSNTNRTAL